MSENVPVLPEGRRSVGTLVTIVICVALVAVPLVVRQTPREISQWHLASALRHHADHQDAAAQVSLADALRWNPENLNAHLVQSQWERQAKDYSAALAACEQAAQLAPDDVRMLYERSQVLQHLGRGADAVADWKRIAELNEQHERLSVERVWNGLAYARAIANLELDAALADAQKAVEREPNSAELLDTRGYILYRMGKHTEARQDLDKAVTRYEALWETAQRTAAKGPAAGSGEAALSPDVLRELALGLAVMRYHRALVLDALGEKDNAEADRARVRELGFTPDETLF